MKDKCVTKANKKELLSQRSGARKLRATKVEEVFDSDFTKVSVLSGNTSEATERKRVSKNRVVASGHKSMLLNLDPGLMKFLHELYDGAGLKYAVRGGDKCFKAAEVSAMISYLITTFCDNVAANDSLGYKIYLHKILTVVKFREEVQFENAEQICDFLNANKFKRYTSALGIKKGYDSKWEPKNLKIYLEVNAVDELYKAMGKRPKMKRIVRERRL
ncbi:hypothetical protein [Aeromonas salmonicida]|uniref:hypothetical protein n=1 Tax=Aeromonas salmonicida TaxID=645 RepID=UPI00283AA6FF|nr:hypothetical protein [Aeromonas salmonicida]